MRLIMKRGCRLRAVAFISPCVPYRAFSRNVCHTSSSEADTMKPIHSHWFTPAMNRTMNTTKTASKPPAKMKRYWLFSPLNSTDFPIPLFTGYFSGLALNNSSDIAAGLEEERPQDSGGDNQEDTRPEPTGGSL